MLEDNRKELFMDSKKYTLLGYAAIVLWGTGAAFTRTLGESLGAFTAAAVTSIIAGLLAIIYQMVKGGGLKKLMRAPLRYWLVCGPLYVFFIYSSYISVCMAKTREQVMIVVLIKLLWPLMTLVFTVPVLKAKASPWLIGSILVSIIGIGIGNLGDNIKDLPSFVENIASNLGPYLLALASSIAWGLYSTFTSKYISGSDSGDGVGFFLVIGGLMLGALSFAFNEPRIFTTSMIGSLIYQSVFTSFLATICWNLSMIKGNVIAVAVASNLSPVISTVSTGLLLGVPITVPMIIGTVLLVAGTFWSKQCFTATKQKVALGDA